MVLKYRTPFKLFRTLVYSQQSWRASGHENPNPNSASILRGDATMKSSPILVLVLNNPLVNSIWGSQKWLSEIGSFNILGRVRLAIFHEAARSSGIFHVWFDPNQYIYIYLKMVSRIRIPGAKDKSHQAMSFSGLRMPAPKKEKDARDARVGRVFKRVCLMGEPLKWLV